MTIELDHVIVSSRDRVASARLLAQLLGVPWDETAFGVFSPVYINDGLTFDFIQADPPFPVEHFCFRVDDAAFDAILGRIAEAGIAWRSKVRGPVDRQVDTDYGGRGVYWNEPDGHQWEMLTVSYARRVISPLI
jgi:catechol 2,3-dioxygenase-like lactoylglutathione lyase family enzyme